LSDTPKTAKINFINSRAEDIIRSSYYLYTAQGYEIDTMGCRCYKTAVFKLPDLVCRRTYILILILSFYLLRFSPPIIFELAERNSTNIGHMLGSNCDLKTHVKNLGYPPTNQGPKNHLLGPTSQFNGKFNGLCLRNETRYRQSVRYVDNSTRGLLHRPEIS